MILSCDTVRLAGPLDFMRRRKKFTVIVGWRCVYKQCGRFIESHGVCDYGRFRYPEFKPINVCPFCGARYDDGEDQGLIPPDLTMRQWITKIERSKIREIRECYLETVLMKVPPGGSKSGGRKKEQKKKRWKPGDLREGA